MSDNVKLTVKPLPCGDENEYATIDEVLVYREHCVDLNADEPVLPKVYVNSVYVNFNVTNEAVFEDIEFEGNNNLAFY